MSGGDYDYLYGRLNELADRIELRCAKEGLSPEVTALRLRYVMRLRLMSDAARAIEWVDSGDYGAGREIEPLRAALCETRGDAVTGTQPHLTHFDDCGCKSAEYEQRIRKLQTAPRSERCPHCGC